MTHLICIHGHFYQPDRSDPWTGQIPVEPGAAPFHDWNERINAECYRPNAAARVLGEGGRIESISSNYEHISWNAGPSLMRWLERADPWTHEQMVRSDARAQVRFGGHGPAIGQPWVHAILPLCSPRDRRTLIRWGIADFERRFGRRPAGMWLPEAAVDTATLVDLAAAGIEFTVLAPWQAGSVAAPGAEWSAVGHEVDTTRPYRCELPSGDSISLWFYDGALSAGIAFGGWLDSGRDLAARCVAAAERATDDDALVHVATDGESYGHHHHWGDMALAAALGVLDGDPTCRLTVYGEALAITPPTWAVRIAEPTSWSCAHGIDRWRADCGCQTGGPAGWNQAWRAPLRAALDWLTDALADRYESITSALVDDPWAARDDYGTLLASVGPSMTRRRELAAERAFTSAHGGSPQDAARLIGALEMQRYALQSLESSAWFYADAGGPEAVLALRHAARALEWCEELGGASLVDEFVALLAEVRSNDPAIGDGVAIWHRSVISARPTKRVVTKPRPDDHVDRVSAAIARLTDARALSAAGEAFERLVIELAERLVIEADAAEQDAIAAQLVIIERLAAGLGLAELPGRWRLQNALVDARDRRAAAGAPPFGSALLSLATSSGVDPHV